MEGKKEGKFIEENNVEKELKNIGVDERAIQIFLAKSKFRRIKLYKIRNAIANILKQEALSVGADVAVNKGCVNCTVAYSDVLVMGTVAQLKKLVEKMKYNVSESKEVAEEIEILINH